MKISDMKIKMKVIKSLIAAIAAVTICSATLIAAEPDNTSFLAKTITSERKVDVGSGYVSVKISGQYPQSGNAELLTAVRQWLADFLSHANQGEQPMFATPPELLGNGRMLVRRCSNALIRTSEADMRGPDGEDWGCPYEFDIAFAPSYNSGRLLTYTFSEYMYLGGAHGSTLLMGQTFNAENGEMLTNENVFLPDKKADLLDLIRNALWEQYFEKKFPDESLELAVLIDPEVLDLPAGNPQFGKSGITFVYQQYEIAPYSFGLPSCTIPYSELRNFFSPQTLKLINLR